MAALDKDFPQPRRVLLPVPLSHKVMFHKDDLVDSIHRDDDPEQDLIYRAYITTVTEAPPSGKMGKIHEWGGRIQVLGDTKGEAIALRDAIVDIWNGVED